MISRTAACPVRCARRSVLDRALRADRPDVIAANGNAEIVLKWAGATWLLLALVGAGIGLVRRAALWLRIVLGVAVPLLALVLLSLAYGVMDRILLADAVFGAVILTGSVVLVCAAAPDSRSRCPT